MEWIYSNISIIISCIVSVLFGGLAGNVYAQRRTDKRNAKQKIVKEISMNQIHRTDASANFKISITENDKTYHFENLYIVKIQISIKGNIRFDDLDLIVDMPDSFKILKATPNIKSRAREIEFKSAQPSYENPLSNIDLEINPFNTKDVFSIDLQVYSLQNEILDVSSIEVDTRNDIEFVTV
ncbi:hypothetical protein H7X65_02815 [Candidatus Parcubacteria bacterium]|nr:hypothetical protein [Candidatus Parcubacteria bacterium]